MASSRIVSAERIIPAPRHQLFEIVATPALHSVIDGSGSVQAIVAGPDRLALGVQFGASMRIGVGYKVTNTVSAFVEDECIAWHHFAGFVWSYAFSDVEGGTKVVERFDYSNLLGLGIAFTPTPKRNQQNMAKTLERLERYALTGSAEA
jgi:Polyketide cyclase / dehydrase and lipid transport